MLFVFYLFNNSFAVAFYACGVYIRASAKWLRCDVEMCKEKSFLKSSANFFSAPPQPLPISIRQRPFVYSRGLLITLETSPGLR